jgi:hypothetical protein
VHLSLGSGNRSIPGLFSASTNLFVIQIVDRVNSFKVEYFRD